MPDPTPQPPAFAGSVPNTYHTFLGPLIFDAYARDIAARLGACPGARILELAAGTGIVTKKILQGLAADATLVVTDLSEPMLNVARTTVGPDPRVTYRTADACQLPFEDRSFDVLVCQYGLMFFPDKVRAMQEARRVLRPGGRYILNVWDSLEHNPIPRTVHEVVTGLYPANPPMFLAKMPFGYSDQAEIRRVTLAGGFTACELETVGFPCEAPQALDAARAWVEGTPILAALAERGVTDPGPVREAVRAALAARFGERPCRSTMRAIVATAR